MFVCLFESGGKLFKFPPFSFYKSITHKSKSMKHREFEQYEMLAAQLESEKKAEEKETEKEEEQ